MEVNESLQKELPFLPCSSPITKYPTFELPSSSVILRVARHFIISPLSKESCSIRIFTIRKITSVDFFPT